MPIGVCAERRFGFGACAALRYALGEPLRPLKHARILSLLAIMLRKRLDPNPVS
jgi:hypothetical protein